MLPSFDLSGQVVLITGGSRGIGRAIALAFAEAGASVAIVGRNAEALDKTYHDLRPLCAHPLAVHADTSRVPDIERAVAEVGKQLGPIDILVNNAGTAILEPSVDVTEEHWDKVVDTNLKGYFFFASRIARDMMIPRGGGKIINVASEEGIQGVPGHAAYCASKAGVIHLTRVLAVEWGAAMASGSTASPPRR